MNPGSGSAPSTPTPNSNANASNVNASQKIDSANRQKSAESLARAEGNRNNLGTRLPQKGSGIDSGVNSGVNKTSRGYNPAANTNNGANSDINRRRQTARENGNRKMQNLKRQMEVEALKKLAATYGIPEPVSDKLLKSGKGQKLLDMVEKKKNMNPLKNGLPFSKKKQEEDRKEKKEQQGEEETEGEAVGRAAFKISLKVIKFALFLGPMGTLILMFTILIVASLSDDKISSIILSGMAEKKANELREEVGTGNGYDFTGKGDDFPEEYYERLSRLGNLYSSQKECVDDECFETAEFLYYLKIADIKTRYEKKYSVYLDWYLISSTNLYFDDGTENIMQANLGGYDRDTVEDIDSPSGLDWDNDYKNINGYLYLDADDSTYDLQILAKNMVTKKTVQKCIDSSGNVVKSQEDTDVEDSKLQGSKKLSCGSGQTYSINSTYTKDEEKFKEFMLEYIDLKMFEKGSGSKENSSSTCNISTSDAYLWPIGSKETSQGMDGKTYALGEPEVGRANISRGFGPDGHQGLDIHSNGRTNEVNIIASRAGTVIYPTDKSQTGFIDNGSPSDGGGYGNHVKIKHDDGTYTLYGHLYRNSIVVFAGERVEAGQVIAKMGHSGKSTGPHLHFEVRNTSDVRQDPLKYVSPEDPRPDVSTKCTVADNDLATKMVELAVSQIDDPEAVNGKKYWSWFGSNNRFEWCAAFVSWVVANTQSSEGKLSDILNYKSASTGMWINHFYNTDNIKFVHNDSCSKLSGKNGTDTKYIPKKGDIIFFDWNGDWNGTLPTVIGPADHIGIVQRVENDKIITIEGNSSNKVAERSYSMDSCNVIGFGSWY